MENICSSKNLLKHVQHARNFFYYRSTLKMKKKGNREECCLPFTRTCHCFANNESLTSFAAPLRHRAVPGTGLGAGGDKAGACRWTGKTKPRVASQRDRILSRSTVGLGWVGIGNMPSAVPVGFCFLEAGR